MVVMYVTVSTIMIMMIYSVSVTGKVSKQIYYCVYVITLLLVSKVDNNYISFCMIF